MSLFVFVCRGSGGGGGRRHTCKLPRSPPTVSPRAIHIHRKGSVELHKEMYYLESTGSLAVASAWALAGRLILAVYYVHIF